MPAKDKYFEAVVKALVKDGWTITDEEVHFPFATRSAYVDLLAEKPLIARKENLKIAVEVKTFGGSAKMSDLEKAIGQFVIYQTALELAEMEHDLFLAVPAEMGEFFQHPSVAKMRLKHGIKVFTYDPIKEVIVEWID